MANINQNELEGNVYYVKKCINNSEFGECIICYDTFNGLLNPPFICRHCGSTYCEFCRDKITTKEADTPTVKCAVCRKEM